MIFHNNKKLPVSFKRKYDNSLKDGNKIHQLHEVDPLSFEYWRNHIGDNFQLNGYGEYIRAIIRVEWVTLYYQPKHGIHIYFGLDQCLLNKARLDPCDQSHFWKNEGIEDEKEAIKYCIADKHQPYMIEGILLFWKDYPYSFDTSTDYAALKIQPPVKNGTESN